MVTGVGMPPEAIAAMKDAPFWPALEAVAHTLAVRHEGHGRSDVGHAATVRPVGLA